MRNLVVDIGNTFAKAALFNNREIEKSSSTAEFNLAFLEQFAGGEHIDSAIISSVDQEVSEIESHLKSRYKYIRFNAGLSGRVKNNYKTPSTLGLDRLAAVIGAEAQYPGRNVLVIDAGTCITYDFIDSSRNYYGGSISPGIGMRFKAMNEFTERLPLIDFDAGFEGKLGDDTRSAMLAGVQQGTYYEAIGFIQSYSEQYPELQILLCGGDAMFFDSRLKSSIFAHSFETQPNLVLTGLNEVIYQYND
ncbi:MAG: type pantothenate kinase [Sphingobacteriaceae bacterium]|jgi:type III pantothenate kinase|nr:type pantothenate kinase [Sphingobacteriaceae bacterium]